jgi:transposase
VPVVRWRHVGIRIRRVVGVSTPVCGLVTVWILAVPEQETVPAALYEQVLAENARLAEQLAEALTQIAELRARLAASSRNSSKPPSSDGLAKPAPRSLRKASGRGPGRPKGQAGFTLQPVASPQHQLRHEPDACAGCGAGLAGAEVVDMESRQVFDLPVIGLEVTQHDLVSRRCRCGTVTKASPPVGVDAPVQYGPRIAGTGVYLFHGQFLSKARTAAALGDVFGAPVAEGTIASWVAKTAARITDQVLPVIRDRIAGAAVAHFDETGLRTAGKLGWLHSASTPTDVLLSAHAKRGTKAMDAAGVLPTFTGVAVHDAWAPYDTYTGATHALCNAHALRELTYVNDTAPAPVADLAQQAIDALTSIKDLVDAQPASSHPAGTATGQPLPSTTTPAASGPPAECATGSDTDTPTKLAHHKHLLRSALVIGKADTAARAGKLERKYNNLFTRLLTRWDDYLRFSHDPRVPFDNNPAERTIRMPKLRIKVSGSLRTTTGADEFAAIRSYTDTATRQGQTMFNVLVQAATGTCWIPGTA